MTMDDQQAKQLDSVTDRVDEKELDESKAQEAMSALSSEKATDDKHAALAAVAVSKEDVALLVSELQITEDQAQLALREAATSKDKKPGDSMVVAAMRRFVVM